MKKFLLLAAVAVGALTVQAQSVQFVYEGEALENGAEVVVSEFVAEDGEMPWHASFRNNTNRDVELKMSFVCYDNKYKDLFMGMGDAVTMCVGGQCMGGESAESPAFVVPANSETALDLHTALTLMSNNPDVMASLGLTVCDDAYAKVDYTLVNTQNEDDFTYVTVVYDLAAGTHSVEGTLVSREVNVFQRGENVVCNFTFDAAANRTVEVINIVGARVASVALNGNNGEVVLPRLAKGVYVYTLVENGRNVKSQKIVVR